MPVLSPDVYLSPSATATYRNGFPFEFLSLEQIDQQGQNNTDHNHGCNGNKNLASLSLNTDIARQFAEPVEKPGGKVQYQSDTD
jgi:hypothetical protein